jgi:flavodoxin
MIEPLEPKVLVVYFSRTGTTKKLAEAIAHATRGELEPLREARSRSGLLGWLRSGYEGTYHLSVTPLPLQRDPGAYDLVFVGSPCWSRAVSSPVRGFLQEHGKKLRHVALFATCDGQGAQQAIAEMASLLARPALACLAMRKADVQHGPAVWVGEHVEAALQAWERRCSAEPPAVQASG